MKTNKIELKPCPFCGSHNLGLRLMDGYEFVACLVCWARGSEGMTEKDAIEAWNKRSKSDDL